MRSLVVVACALGCRSGATRERVAVAPLDARPAVVDAGACDPASTAVADPDGAALLEALTGTMEVALSAPALPRQLTVPHAEVAPPGAVITGVTFHAYRLDGAARVPLTAAELDRVIFRGAVLRLRSFGVLVEHHDADCAYTLRELVRAIEVSDRQTRGASPWFPGIDLHHVDLESVRPAAGGAWRVAWQG